jgi:RNA polymerase sigma factor (sigma-70 family)
MSINVVLADDHAMFRAGLKSLLERQDDMSVVGEAVSGERAVALAQEMEPDVIVMDVGMPGLNGIEATRQLQDRAPDVRVVALTVHRDQEVVTRMLGAGAQGYLIKDCAFEELIDAVRAVAGGETYISEIVGGPDIEDHLRRAEKAESAEDICPLSPREREVLQLLAEGMPSKKIGLELGISVKTVETHRSRLMRKLGIRTVAELTKYAVRQHMTPLEK